ncbi:putative reverse transcriptase domain-containing protein [Tanacetum coccineum]
MSLTMTTRSAGWPAAASPGGGTGGRAGRGGGRTRGRSAQVGDQGRGRGNGRNQNGDVVNDNIRGDVSRGCTYKEFLACNPKEYDGKGGSIGANDLSKAMQIAGTLTNEALRNGSTKKNHEKRGNGGEPSKDRNDCRVAPRNVNPVNAKNPVARTCYECGSSDHIQSACPRLNQAQRPGGNHQNQVMAVNGGQGHGNQGNQARGRAFMLGAEEARFATTLFDSGALERCGTL